MDQMHNQLVELPRERRRSSPEFKPTIERTKVDIFKVATDVNTDAKPENYTLNVSAKSVSTHETRTNGLTSNMRMLRT